MGSSRLDPEVKDAYLSELYGRLGGLNRRFMSGEVDQAAFRSQYGSLDRHIREIENSPTTWREAFVRFGIELGLGAITVGLASRFGSKAVSLDDFVAAQGTYSRTYSRDGIRIYSELAGRPIRTVDDLASALKSGLISPSKVEVNLVYRDGAIYALNTRTMMALREAGIKPTDINFVPKTKDPFFNSLLEGQLGRNPGAPFGFGEIGPKCFPGFTLIATADGLSKPISELRAGDVVLAYSPSAEMGRGELLPKRITRLYNNVTTEWIRLVWERDGREYELITTPGHHFLDWHGEFPAINELLEDGRAKIVLSSGELIDVFAERIVYANENGHLFEEAIGALLSVGASALPAAGGGGWRTYNIEVEDLHTYVAGGVRVHNLSEAWAHELDAGLAAFDHAARIAKVPLDYAASLGRAAMGVEDVGGRNGNPVGYTSAGRAITLDRTVYEKSIAENGGKNASPSARAEAAARGAIAAGHNRTDAFAAAYKEAELAGANTSDPGFVARVDRAARNPDSGSSGKGGGGSSASAKTPSTKSTSLSGATSTTKNTATQSSSGKGGGGESASRTTTSKPSRNTPSKSETKGGGRGASGKPVLLDLDGNGFSMTGRHDSNLFLDIGGDGYKHRSAWVGAGDGVLMVDADGDGKISSRKEVVFTDWDPSADNDMQALEQVFDTNGNGRLDAGDAQWTSFKIMVTGADGAITAKTLAELGIQSIDLRIDQTTIAYEDGSSIDGQTIFTRTDGSTGTAASATLTYDQEGYQVTEATSIDGAGNRTITSSAHAKDGALKSVTSRTASVDGLVVTTRFDQNGDGVFDRILTDVTVVNADGSRTRTETNRNGGGILIDSTSTVKSSDGRTITISSDERGGGYISERETQVTGVDNSLTVTVQELAQDGTLIKQAVTAHNADRLTRTVRQDANGDAYFERSVTSDTVYNGDGSRTERTSVKGGEGNLLSSTAVTINAGNRSRTETVDANGDGVADFTVASATSRDVNGTTTVIETSSARDGSAFGKVTTTVSANGLSKTSATDLDGDAATDRTTSDTTVIAADGSRTRTISATAQSGKLLSQSVEQRSADGLVGTINNDTNGDGTTDQVIAVTRDAAGIATETMTALSANGTLLSKSVKTTSADRLSSTTQFDRHGRNIFDEIVIETTQRNADGTSTRSTERRSENNTLIARSVETTSADGLTVNRELDGNGDGQADQRGTTGKVLSADGSQVITVEERSGNGTLLNKVTTSINADRSNTITQGDSDGDGNIDLWERVLRESDGRQMVDSHRYAASGALISKKFTYVDPSGLFKQEFDDVDGDWSNDFVTSIFTRLLNDGGNSIITSKVSASGSLLSRSVVTTSGNGFSVVQEADVNGDGVVDNTGSTTTVIEDNGSKAVTQSTMVGTTLAMRATVTTSANGLTSKTLSDLNGDGVTDRTMSQRKTLNTDGSTYSSAESYAADGSLISRTEINASADGKLVTQGIDQDGNGAADRWIVDTISSNGERVRSVTERNAVGAALSSSITTVAPDQLTVTTTFDFNGDDTPDMHRRVYTTIAPDGLKTTSYDVFSGSWSLKEQTKTIVSADGLTKEVIYSDGNYNPLRAYNEVTIVHQDGSRQHDRVVFLNADWSRESHVATWTSADKRTVTVTKDVDGDFVADQFTRTQLNNDGTTSQVFSDYQVDGQAIARQTVIDTSGNGLSTTYTYDFDGNGVADAQVTKITAIGADGGKTTTTDYKAGENGALVLKGREVASTSADGLIENLQWDDTGAGLFNRRQSKTTVLNADGSQTTTDQQFENGQSVRGLTTTVSANRLATSKQLDFDGDGTVDQRQTETLVLNANGTSTRTTASIGPNAAVLSTETTSTSADGKTITVKDVSAIDGVASRTTISVSRERADGGSVKVESIRNAADQLVERITTTVSDDKRLVQIERDTNGDGQADQTEQVVTTVDGRRVSTLTNFANGSMSGRMTTTEAASGLSSVVEIDRNADGTADTRKVQQNSQYADGSREVVVTETDLRSGKLRSKTTKTSSADGKAYVEATDVDGDGVVDQTARETILASGVRQTSVTNNAGARKSDQKLNDETYWNDKVPAATQTTTSADGLVKTTTLDVDGDGRFEVSMDAKTRIDGSVVTTVVETNSDGSTKSRGLYEVSHDGVVNIFRRDGNNDGYFEFMETTTKRSSGGIERTTVTRENTGTVIKSTQTVVDSFGNILHSKTVDGIGRTLEEQIRATNGTSTRTTYVAATGAIRVIEVLDAFDIVRSVTHLDPANVESWARVEQIFDAAGVKTLEKQFLDDGTTAELFYRATDGVIYESRTFAANAALTSTTLYDAQGRKTSTVLHDPLNQQTWTRIEQTFDAAGIKTLEKQFLDDGKRIELFFRASGGIIHETQNFAADGNLLSKTFYDATGKETSAVVYDPFNQNEWSRVEQTFDTAGVKTLERQFLDNGTRADLFYRSPGGQLYETRLFSAAGLLTNRTEYDTGNSQTWSRREHVMDAHGRVTQMATVNDNGASTVDLFDPANAQAWSQFTQVFNGAGTLESQLSRWDDGSTETINYDVGNSQIWSRYELYMDSSGRVLTQVNFNDNGSRSVYSLDPTNAQTWSLHRQDYNAANQLYFIDQTNDNGTHNLVNYDVHNNQGWSRYDQYVDSSGRVLSQVNYNDNGTRHEYSFDPTNVQTWTKITQLYNTANALEWQANEWDDGSIETMSFNVHNNQPWSKIAQVVNAAGTVTFAATYQSDNSRFVKYWDATNSQPWSYLEQYINAAGQVTAQFQRRDDGAIEENRYNGQGTARQIATFDPDYYLAANPDVAAGWFAPAIDHYNQYGFKEGRNPNAWFNTSFVLQNNVDLRNNGINPFLHWRDHGYAEGRAPHAGYQRFDARSQNDLAGISEPLLAQSQVLWVEDMRQDAKYYLNKWHGKLPRDRPKDKASLYWIDKLNQVAAGDDRKVLSMFPEYRATHFEDPNWRASPVLLDLNDDNHIDFRPFDVAAFETGQGPRFDWDSDGITDGTAWVGPADGWLAIDLAADGSAGPDGAIDQSKELAFTMWKTPDELAGEQITDLEAVRLVFDTNHNNLLDPGDARWSEFRVWQDANQNGVSEAGELRTLVEADIRLIELVPTSDGARQFADGSAITGTSSYLKGDGSRALVADAAVAYRTTQPSTAVA